MNPTGDRDPLASMFSAWLAGIALAWVLIGVVLAVTGNLEWNPL